ncbi:MAG: tetratricopeptide repeat protein [Anaerolineae bacterium]|nr:tetratricopeptide repeat protein [Anaerolineae bacterium]
MSKEQVIPRLTGERKLVTIMFADISGFTALAEVMDPETVRDLVNACFERLVPIVEKYGGMVDKFIGDEIMALFGAPIAHENDPERALHAAMEMLRTMDEFGAEWDTDRLNSNIPTPIKNLQLHLGINTGLVIAGDIGTHGRQEYSVIGDAVNLAARLKDTAKRGEILVGPDTYHLIAPLFEFESLGPVQVKGRVEAVPVYRLLRARTIAGKARDIAGLQSPLVGRQTELHTLRNAVERLRTGVGGIVTVVGEAGLGKSRLITELRSQSTNRSTGQPADIQWVEGHCLSYGTSVAYLLWLDVLHGLLEMTADGSNPQEDSPIAVRNRLWEQVYQRCQECADCSNGLEQAAPFESIYPYLGHLMSLPLKDEAEAVLRDLEGESLKKGTFRAIECLISCSAQKRPLVVVCEDLHWADPTSIELLERLLALTERVPLLLLCVFRPEMEHGCWRIREIAARLYRHRHTDVQIAPLSSADSDTLVESLLYSTLGSHEREEGTEGLPQQVKTCILNHTEGNPFYMEEIIRSLIDSGAIAQDTSTGQWRAVKRVIDIAIPDTLNGVLMSRIDRLHEETKRVLQLAAVIGRTFLYHVLAVIARERDALNDHLLALQREQMIYEKTRVPEIMYNFRHHLIQEAAYDSLLRKERRIFHRQVAETLEELSHKSIEDHADYDNPVELLAHHWERAEEPAKAAHYLLRAGDRARRLGASLEAIEFYQSALEKAAVLEASGDTIELNSIHEKLGDVYLENLSRHDEALEHYATFIALARSGEDLARGMRKVGVVHLLRGELKTAHKHYEAALAQLDSLPPLAETSRVHCGFAYLYVCEDQLEKAIIHARAGLDISDKIGDIRGLADANRQLGVIADARRELDSACTYFERSLELYRELGDLPRLAQACNNVGDSYRQLGQMGQALERLDEGLQVTRRVGDTRDEALLLMTKAQAFLDQGQWEPAIKHLERALTLADKSDVVGYMIAAHLNLGSAYRGVGQLENARRHLEIAETMSEDRQQVQFVSQIDLELAYLNATQAGGDDDNRMDDAWKYVQLAKDSAGKDPSAAFMGLVHRCQGYLYGCQNRWNDAVKHLEKSLKFLEHANLPAEEGKTRLDLGVAYASRGEKDDREYACEQLRAARSLFQQIEAKGYLAQVEAHLKSETHHNG